MPWRKWMVRVLAFGVVAAVAAAALLYQRYTNPAAMRAQVIAQFTDHLPGGILNLESASLRLLGGIAFSDLRLARRDDPNQADVLCVPAGVIYHDKEQLLDRKLVIRKLVLQRPRFRVVRRPDGSWNLKGILGPVDLSKTIPALVIQQGTFLIHDGKDRPPLEVRDVHLTIVNDPVRILNFKGTGHSDLLGTVRFEGTTDRLTDDFAATFEVDAIPVNRGLVGRLAAYSADLAHHAGKLEGLLRLHAQVVYRPDSSAPWSHQLALHLTRGKLSHELLPMDLEEVDARVRCVDGQIMLDSCTARAGEGRLELTGRIERPSPETDLEGKLIVRRLAVSSPFFARLPEMLAGLKEVNEDFQPSGPIDGTFAFRRRAGRWHKHCLLHPQGMRATCAKFPYPVQGITGKIEMEVDQTDTARPVDHILLNLAGSAGGQPVRVEGRVEGDRPAAVNVVVSGENIPLDETLLSALPAEHQQLARKFHAAGLANFMVEVRRARGSRQFRNRYFVRFHQGALKWDEFRYPLENVTGVLDIHPDFWEFRDFQGTHKGGEVRIHGRSQPTPQGDQLHIALAGSNVPLDGELEEALSPELKKAWKAFVPTGRLNFAARVVRRLEAGEPRLEVSVAARGGSIRPQFFPCRLDDLSGTVHFSRRWLYLRDVRARQGASQVSLKEAKVYLKQTGGLWAELVDLQGNPIQPDAALIEALPDPLRKACASLQLQGPLYLRTGLRIDLPSEPEAPPRIYWDGGVAVRDVNLNLGVPLERVTGRLFCRGLHNGHEVEDVVGNLQLEQATLFKQPVQQIHSSLEIRKDSPAVLRLPDLKAKLFGGDIGGQARIEFGSALRYEVDLTAARMDIAQFGRHNDLGPDAQLRGLAGADLYLAGEGADLANFQGRGSIDVEDGKMYNLPPLLRLLKVVMLRSPEKTAFEEAHCRFAIRGDRVQVNRLDLFGDAISLGGQGDMKLDGSDLNLDFHAVWGRLPQVLPRGLRNLPPAISKQLFKIKMRGPLSDVRCDKEAVPVLAEPLRGLLERMSGGRTRNEER